MSFNLDKAYVNSVFKTFKRQRLPEPNESGKNYTTTSSTSFNQPSANSINCSAYEKEIELLKTTLNNLNNEIEKAAIFSDLDKK